MKAKLTHKTAVMAFQLCVTNIGRSIHQKTLPLLDITDHHERYLGEYCSTYNVIYVYLMQHKSVRSLVSTVIHEYAHYLQPNDNTYEIVRKQLDAVGLGYNDHPMEQMACEMEKKYCNDFMKQINLKY